MRNLTIYAHIYASGYSHIHSRRRSNLNIWICRLSSFPGFSFESPFSQLKPCLKFWGLPRKRVWYARGLLWKLVGNAGSRKYFKSDLLCLWIHSWILFRVTGTPFSQLKPCLKFWGLPRKRVWFARGLLWKLVGNFGSRKHFKSALLCLWTRISDMGWHNIVFFIGLFCKRHTILAVVSISSPISSVCGSTRPYP